MGTGSAKSFTMLVRICYNWVRSLTWINRLVIVGVIAILIALLVPPRPTARVYFQGKSQFHWMNQLGWDEDPENRKAAAIALGEIIRTNKIRYRCAMVSVLANSGAEGKPAIAALKELLDDDDEELRRAALSAIERIDPEEFSKVSGR
jgi:hypothetical protein